MRVICVIMIVIFVLPCMSALSITPSLTEVDLRPGISQRISLIPDEEASGEINFKISDNLKNIIKITKEDSMSFTFHVLPDKDLSKGKYEGDVLVSFESKASPISGEYSRVNVPIKVRVFVESDITGNAVYLRNEQDTYEKNFGGIIFIGMIITTLSAIMVTSYRSMRKYRYYRS